MITHFSLERNPGDTVFPQPASPLIAHVQPHAKTLLAGGGQGPICHGQVGDVNTPEQKKSALVDLGLELLAMGEMGAVEAISLLIRRGGMVNV